MLTHKQPKTAFNWEITSSSSTFFSRIINIVKPQQDKYLKVPFSIPINFNTNTSQFDSTIFYQHDLHASDAKTNLQPCPP